MDALPPEIIEKASHFKPNAKALSPIVPLLNELLQKGLVQMEGDSVHFHELVRERCDCWMQQHPEQTEGLSAQQVLQRYGEPLFERLDDPQDRAISHGNLTNYLAKASDYPACAAHRLAQIIYCFVTGHRQDLKTALSNHAISAKQAAEADISYRLPLWQDLVRQPEFAVLRDFIQARGQSIAALQAAVDELL